MDEFKNALLDVFLKSSKHLWGANVSWVRELRKSAVAKFEDLGFPTETNEEWRFTNIDPITQSQFSLPSRRNINDLKAAKLDGFTNIVFVNGYYAPELSATPLPNDIRITNLANALDSKQASLERHLANYAKYENQCFTALNTAFMTDGALIHLPKGTTLQEPIHIQFISTSNGEATISYPRNLVIIEPDAKATIVEEYIGNGESGYLTNSVSEIVVGENSTLNHYKIQREQVNAFHISTLQVSQARNSSFSSNVLSFGGAIVRNSLNVALEKEGSECILNGLYMVTGTQLVDNHTEIQHIKPHTISRELYKGILDGKSRAVFNGKIIVRPDAQKTDALQVNKNLLLSDGGLVNTKPQLEIFANDVKCKHGATIGQLNKDAIFYLRSRGIDYEQARKIIIYAFANEMITHIKESHLREWLEKFVNTKLGQI